MSKTDTISLSEWSLALTKGKSDQLMTSLHWRGTDKRTFILLRLASIFQCELWAACQCMLSADLLPTYKSHILLKNAVWVFRLIQYTVVRFILYESERTRYYRFNGPSRTLFLETIEVIKTSRLKSSCVQDARSVQFSPGSLFRRRQWVHCNCRGIQVNKNISEW